jgi:organic radical activating enzyme
MAINLRQRLTPSDTHKLGVVLFNILDGQLNVRLQVQLHKLLWGDEKGK